MVPPLGAGQCVVNPRDAGYNKVASDHNTHKHPKNISKQIIWNYGSQSNQGFFSHIGSGTQRLPNGNTMICSMTEGHVFEITNDFELVWEYINPVSRVDGTVKVMPDRLPMVNALFRAYRYGPNHFAFKGQGLKPLGTNPPLLPTSGNCQKRKGVVVEKVKVRKAVVKPKAKPDAFIPY
ncbi:MAG: hypothetical protein JRJ23_04680 [Deltaproteobacteria bacterium]|nr:hypothetical protein [Deltaproteobacteria bacterium]